MSSHRGGQQARHLVVFNMHVPGTTALARTKLMNYSMLNDPTEREHGKVLPFHSQRLCCVTGLGISLDLAYSETIGLFDRYTATAECIV